jgi:hypothetical protein
MRECLVSAVNVTPGMYIDGREVAATRPSRGDELTHIHITFTNGNTLNTDRGNVLVVGLPTRWTAVTA